MLNAKYHVIVMLSVLQEELNIFLIKDRLILNVQNENVMLMENMVKNIKLDLLISISAFED
jgi:hypothetical protein